MEKIIIFDTTLRDGEQSPGASLEPEEKLELAVQLERLGVDIIEAGFPVASSGDFDAVCLIAKRIKKTFICALARALKKDMDTALKALKKAKTYYKKLLSPKLMNVNIVKLKKDLIIRRIRYLSDSMKYLAQYDL